VVALRLYTTSAYRQVPPAGRLEIMHGKRRSTH
jgi:hypothetical protein